MPEPDPPTWIAARRPAPPVSVPTQTSAWRGPGSHGQRPPPKPPVAQARTRGFRARLRRLLGLRS
jgi:hypothetical protein